MATTAAMKRQDGQLGINWRTESPDGERTGFVPVARGDLNGSPLFSPSRSAVLAKAALAVSVEIARGKLSDARDADFSMLKPSLSNLELSYLTIEIGGARDYMPRTAEPSKALSMCEGVRLEHLEDGVRRAAEARVMQAAAETLKTAFDYGMRVAFETKGVPTPDDRNDARRVAFRMPARQSLSGCAIGQEALAVASTRLVMRPPLDHQVQSSSLSKSEYDPFKARERRSYKLALRDLPAELGQPWLRPEEVAARYAGGPPVEPFVRPSGAAAIMKGVAEGLRRPERTEAARSSGGLKI
ncbi:hypothetical protein [Azospirillum sp. TSO5]|uniref:hypothetical protein n=1 Tax=Azospirillum sp. TSO5 TaxID=716760 RepID=UPI000D60E22E|nr:hypothetical protein [Azospirillum sp. TSO5]PWC92913.1 hypothetical protein TSO5_15915 [Azospirillum sp. TSO5]